MKLGGHGQTSMHYGRDQRLHSTSNVTIVAIRRGLKMTEDGAHTFVIALRLHVTHKKVHTRGQEAGIR
jgi:hypothetical protein